MFYKTSNSFSTIWLYYNLKMKSSKIQAPEESRLSNDAENTMFNTIINIKKKSITCLKQCLLLFTFIG